MINNTFKVVDFEDLTLQPESFNNGSDGSGGFTTNGAFFNNNFNFDFGSWSGWSYSNTTDTTTPGFVNQYSSFAGGGANSSSNYGVAFTFNAGDATIDLPDGYSLESARITNTTYAALSIENGDSFAKQFGGESGNDPDFFLLTITGLDNGGNSVGEVDFYLADYRFEDNSQDFIVNDWEFVDLSSLDGATQLSFELTSSDNDPVFGLNTPAYFALDNLILVDSDLQGDGENLLGTEGNDYLVGTQQDDLIEALAGNDTLLGKQGNDLMNGGNGNDILDADNGNDILNGGNGNDILSAGNGNDTLNGGFGNDTLNGAGGNDLIIGSGGDDLLNGDNGNDTLNGGSGTDRLVGGGGNDVFVLSIDSSSDTFSDFNRRQDFIGLSDGLTLDQLEISGNNSTSIVYEGNTIAVISGLESSRLEANRFVEI